MERSYEALSLGPATPARNAAEMDYLSMQNMDRVMHKSRWRCGGIICETFTHPDENVFVHSSQYWDCERRLVVFVVANV